jgi:hypothetical protein
MLPSLPPLMLNLYQMSIQLLFASHVDTFLSSLEGRGTFLVPLPNRSYESSSVWTLLLGAGQTFLDGQCSSKFFAGFGNGRFGGYTWLRLVEVFRKLAPPDMTSPAQLHTGENVGDLR